MREDEKRRIIILNIIQKKKIYRNFIKREFKFKKKMHTN